MDFCLSNPRLIFPDLFASTITTNQITNRLTGFKKRKDERRAKAKEIKDRLLKEAKQKAKQAKRDEVKKLLINYQLNNPEAEELIKPVNYDLPEHVVTITEMDLNQMAGMTNSGLGSNNEQQMREQLESVRLPSSSSKQKRNRKRN